jgi:hypothetical protein
MVVWGDLDQSGGPLVPNCTAAAPLWQCCKASNGGLNPARHQCFGIDTEVPETIAVGNGNQHGFLSYMDLPQTLSKVASR